MMTRLHSIERQQTKYGYHFVVTVRCVANDQWDVKEVLTANELATYPAFKKAMLKRAGLLFVDDHYEERGGATNWSNDVQHLIGAPARGGAA